MNVHSHETMLEVSLQSVESFRGSRRVTVDTRYNSEVKIRHYYLDVLVCLGVVAHVHEVGVEVVADTVGRSLDLAAMVSVPFGHAAPSLSCVLFVTQGAGHQVDDEPGLTSVMSTDVILSCRPATCVGQFSVSQPFTSNTVLVVKPVVTRWTMNSRTVSVAVTTSAPHLPVFSPNHQLADIFILPRDGTDVRCKF